MNFKKTIIGSALLLLAYILHSITYLILLSIIIAGEFPAKGEVLEGVVFSTILIAPIGFIGIGAILVIIITFFNRAQLLLNIKFMIAIGLFLGVIAAITNDYLGSIFTMLRSIL
jgi:hypothetical protein